MPQPPLWQLSKRSLSQQENEAEYVQFLTTLHYPYKAINPMVLLLRLTTLLMCLNGFAPASLTCIPFVVSLVKIPFLLQLRNPLPSKEDLLMLTLGYVLVSLLNEAVLSKWVKDSALPLAGLMLGDGHYFVMYFFRWGWQGYFWTVVWVVGENRQGQWQCLWLVADLYYDWRVGVGIAIIGLVAAVDRLMHSHKKNHSDHQSISNIKQYL